MSRLANRGMDGLYQFEKWGNRKIASSVVECEKMGCDAYYRRKPQLCDSVTIKCTAEFRGQYIQLYNLPSCRPFIRCNNERWFLETKW
jgi:hypothetical protein